MHVPWDLANCPTQLYALMLCIVPVVHIYLFGVCHTVLAHCAPQTLAEDALHWHFAGHH